MDHLKKIQVLCQKILHSECLTKPLSEPWENAKLAMLTLRASLC